MHRHQKLWWPSGHQSSRPPSGHMTKPLISKILHTGFGGTEGMSEASTTEQVPKARLVVVDDHALMREAINAILAMDASVEVVGEAQDGQEAIECCRELRPDLVLMDVSMPRMDGLEATRRLKEELPETSVLFLTAHADHRLLMDAVKVGAAGYVIKGERPDNVLDAVRAVLSGRTPLDQGVAMGLLRRIAAEDAVSSVSKGGHPPIEPTTSTEPTASVPNPLTPRETEVLARLVSGKTNRQVEGLDVAIDKVLADVAVADFASALTWYERLLGRPADAAPMEGLAEWHLAEGGGIQVSDDADRAGSSNVTLVVSSLDEQLAALEAEGIPVGPIQGTSGLVKATTVTDPEGNEITFAEDLTDKT